MITALYSIQIILLNGFTSALPIDIAHLRNATLAIGKNNSTRGCVTFLQQGSLAVIARIKQAQVLSVELAVFNSNSSSPSLHGLHQTSLNLAGFDSKQWLRVGGVFSMPSTVSIHLPCIQMLQRLISDP